MTPSNSSHSTKQTIRNFVQRVAFVFVASVSLVFGSVGVAHADSSSFKCPKDMYALDCNALQNGEEFWVPNMCAATPADTAGSDSGSGSGGDNYNTKEIEAAFKFFIGHGFTPQQSAGIVGNLIQESGFHIDPLDTDGVAHGIAQWQGGRLQPMYAWVADWATHPTPLPGSNEKPPLPPDPAGKNSFGGQLNYLIYDLNTHYQTVKNTIKGMDSEREVAVYWNRHYEISNDDTDKRPNNASGTLAAAVAGNWADGVPIVADPTDQVGSGLTSDAAGNCTSSNSGVVGTVNGTNCSSIGKKSSAPDPKTNPYVCVNSEVKCAAGTDAGVGQAYNNGKEYDIRLCKVRGVTVNAFVATNIDQMIQAAEGAHIKMTGGGFRTLQDQIDVRRSNCGSSHYDIYDKPSRDCNPPAARPKYSNHEMGLAVDWSTCLGVKCSPSLIGSHSNSGYKWMKANASKFGFKNFPPEAWHWSVDGK